MLVVIDTNELLRMASASDMSPLFAAWRAGRFDLALSNELLAEMRDAADKPRVRRFLSAVRLNDSSASRLRKRYSSSRRCHSHIAVTPRTMW